MCALAATLRVRISSISIALGSLLSWSGVAQAQCLDYRDFMRQIETINVPGSVSELAFANGYLYVSGTRLLVMDLKNPTSPQIVGQLAMPDYCLGISVTSDRAYLAGDLGALYIVDVSHPEAPALLGSLDVATRGRDVGITGLYAILTVGDDGVRAIDVSDPAHPVLVSALPVLQPFDSDNGIVLVGHYAFVAGGFAGLRILDIEDPSHMALVTTVGRRRYERAYHVSVDGRYAYLPSYSQLQDTAAVSIIDVHDLQAPVVVDQIETRGWAISATKVGPFLFAADYWFGVDVIDVSGPSASHVVGVMPSTTTPNSLIAVNGYAYGGFGLRLQVFDIAPVVVPHALGRLALPGDANDVAVAGDVAYVTSSSGLHVVDVSNEASPMWVTGLALENCRGLDVSPQYADVVDGVSLRIVNVSTPEYAHVVGAITTTGPALDVLSVDSYAYVAEATTGLEIVDCQDPSSPTLVGLLPVPNRVVRLTRRGDLLFAIGGVDLLVIDIEDRVAPTIIGSTSTTFTGRAITVSGDYLYVGGEARLSVFDVTAPQSPTETGWTYLPGMVKAVESSGRYVYLGTTSGLSIVDVADVTAPSHLASYGNADFTGYGAIALKGERIYVGGDKRLVVLPTQCDGEQSVGLHAEPDARDSGPGATLNGWRKETAEWANGGVALRAAGPSPSRGEVAVRYALRQATDIHLGVYDATGRLVRVLCDGWQDAGEYSVTWSGRDVAGRRAGSGVYLLRLMCGTDTETRKVVVLR